MNLETYKQIINFAGVVASNNAIKLSFTNSEDVAVATRLEETSPWLTASGHDFSEITDFIIDNEINGQFFSPQEAKIQVQKQLTHEMIKAIQPVVSQILEDSKAILREMEAYPVVKIHTEERTRQIESLLTGRIQPLLRSPIIEFMADEEKTLKKLEMLLETDYPALFNRTKKYVKILLDHLKKFEADPQARSTVGEASVKIFKDNCSLFRDAVTFRQVRKLQEEPSEFLINTTMFQNKFDDIDALVGKLNG